VNPVPALARALVPLALLVGNPVVSARPAGAAAKAIGGFSRAEKRGERNSIEGGAGRWTEATTVALSGKSLPSFVLLGGPSECSRFRVLR